MCTNLMCIKSVQLYIRIDNPNMALSLLSFIYQSDILVLIAIIKTI